MPMQVSLTLLSNKPVLYRLDFDYENFPIPKKDQVEMCVHSNASGTMNKIKIPVHIIAKYKTWSDSV